MNLRIALLQMLPGNNPEENFEIATKGVIEAVQNKADIVLLPELWNVGYASPDEYQAGPEEWERSSYALGDTRFSQYASLAKEKNIAIGLAFLEKNEDGSLSDSFALLDATGALVLHYKKVHTVDKGWERMFTSGESFPVCALKTAQGKVIIGAMICYDREFPEASRLLMLHGAEIVLVPNACLIDKNRIAQMQTRGFENMCGIAMTNYPEPKHNGRSCAFDGLRVKGEDYDPCLVLADGSSGVWYADFDLEKLRDYRQKEIWGDAYRKPRLYQDLIRDEPKPPFLRPDARR
jgi:predicted amidohydrolase